MSEEKSLDLDMLPECYKAAHPMKLAALLEEERKRPERWEEHRLVELLFELTDACNLSCKHCGSSCEKDGTYLDIEDVEGVVDELAEAYNPAAMRISFTGGEPMLHPDFFEIAEYITSKGFQTGMTTNGMLITKEKARKLADIGWGVITVSIDGLEKSHDEFRQREGAWTAAMKGIDNLLEAGIIPSVTTVANMLNIDELEELKAMFREKGIRVWRVLNIDPIGRALENPELLLDAASSAKMWWFIEDNRINRRDENPEVMASCSHYLGPLHELETRPWAFSCRSGITVASITAKGEFVGCLDVERRPELVMGHIGEDSFVEAWETGYAPYRRSRVEDCEMCQTCEHARFCNGDSQHTWDFDKCAPKLCIGAR